MDKNTLINNLCADINNPSKRVVAFVGAGMSKAAPACIPTWAEVFKLLCEEAKKLDSSQEQEIENYLNAFNLLPHDTELLPYFFKKLRNIMGNISYETTLKHLLQPKSVHVPPAILKLMQIPFTGFITTNLDKLLEIASNEQRQSKTIHHYTESSNFFNSILNNNDWILKIHGTIDDNSSWIFTSDDYAKTIYGNKNWRSGLKNLFSSCRVVFFGFNGSDIDIDPIFDLIAKEQGGTSSPHILFSKDKPSNSKELSNRNIKIIEYGGNEDHSNLLEEIEKLPKICTNIIGTDNEKNNNAIESYYAKLENEICEIVINLPEKAYRFPTTEIFTDIFVDSQYSNWSNDNQDKIVDILSQSHNVIIVGEPGSGKSTLMKYIVMQSIKKKLLPILIDDTPNFFSENESKLKGDIDFFAIIDICLQKYAISIEKQCIETLLREGKVILICEGLEYLSDENINKILDWYSTFSKKWDKSQIIMTSRYNKLSHLNQNKSCKILYVKKNTPESIKTMIYNYLKCILNNPNGIQPKQTELMQLIKDTKALSEFAENNVYLTFIILLFHYNKITNASNFGRVEFINTVILWLMQSNTIANAENIYKALAIKMVEKNRFKISLNEVYTLLKEPPHSFSQSQIQQVINNSGLVKKTANNEVSFWHNSFVEYLATCQIAQLGEDINSGWWKYVSSNIHNERWTEIISFLPECLKSISYEQVDMYFERLAGYIEKLNISDKYKICSFGCSPFKKLIMSEFHFSEISQWKNLITELSRQIINGIDDINLDHKLNILSCYGMIEDERLNDFSNTFQLFKNNKFAYSIIDGIKVVNHINIEIDNFEIRKFLITNQDYNKFINAQGYTKQQYWTNEGWTWRQRNNIEYPLHWNEQQYFKNLPITGVSLYEAEAYCRWLTTTDKTYNYRLPFDEEFECVINEGIIDDKRFHWGNSANEKNNAEANWASCGIRQKTPVGMFPKSTTKSGIADLVGNVEEWVEVKNYIPCKISDGKNIVRGGSAIRYSRLCDSKYRSQSYKHNRYMTIGFRIVRTKKVNNNNFTKNYDTFSLPINKEFISFLQNKLNINNNSSIIDMGCGSGNLTYPLSHISDKITGIDISDTLISIAQKKYPQIQWICNNVSNFDFPKNSYNLVISYESFHLFPKP